ncbi:hypothetical protein FACS189434_08070 [Bacteroidia bacterium]|nr:hypothetical protein FACS189434_08070 [Bacteroidia bacterium]
MEFRFYLTYNGVQTQVEEPIGFDSFVPKIKRGESHGNMWEFGDVSIEFYDVGYKICENAYSIDGIDADVDFLIEYKTDGTSWENFYVGKLLFTYYTENKKIYNSVSIKVGQTGVQMTLKNRMDTKVDFSTNMKSINGTALSNYTYLNRNITFPAKTITGTSRAENTANTANISVPTLSFGFFSAWFMSQTLQGIFDINTNPSMSISVAQIEPLFYAKSGITYSNVRIKANFTVVATNSNFGNRVMIPQYMINQDYDNAVSLPYTEGTITSVQGTTLKTMTCNINISVSIPSGSAFYFFIRLNDTNSGGSGTRDWTMLFLNGAYIEITADTTYQSSIVKSYLLHETLSRITEVITDNALTVKSDYYGRTNSNINRTISNGCGSLRLFSNGLLIRNAQLTSGTAVFSASLKELLDGLDAIDCIGYGVDGNFLRIEPYKYFYNNSIIMECTEIREVIREVDISRCFKQYSGGYTTNKSEENDSLDNFHAKTQYINEIVQSDIAIEKVSKFIADGYAIELTRRKYLDKDTRDWRYDNNIFIVDLSSISSVNISVTNTNNTLKTPYSVYNSRLSPARNAMRWFSWFMQGIKDLTSAKMLFRNSEGYSNAKMLTTDICRIEAQAISENEDLTLSDFADAEMAMPIFKPEKVSFEYPITLSDYNAVKSNPYGLIGFNGEYGWIDSIDFDFNKNMGKFVLIPKR